VLLKIKAEIKDTPLTMIKEPKPQILHKRAKIQNLQQIRNLKKIKSKNKLIRMSNNSQILKIYSISTKKMLNKLKRQKRTILQLMMATPII
jgi:hypothetical protein